MMHNSKLVEAITDVIAIRASPSMRTATRAFVEITLAGLCAARPDVAAVLAGEAVAVPREATADMQAAHLMSLCEHGKRSSDLHYRAMLAASPYAREPGA